MNGLPYPPGRVAGEGEAADPQTMAAVRSVRLLPFDLNPDPVESSCENRDYKRTRGH